MTGNELYTVFNQIGATHLHHANSVKTSCTFLEQGGLLSRAYVEKKGLSQTPQSSDEIDKKLRIWDRIFLDHVDIHHRGGNKKGPNQYGPVLFVFELDLLQKVPKGTDVQVTKINPIYWEGKTRSLRWFKDKQELSDVLVFGEFNKMLVILTSNGMLKFLNSAAKIILDDPKQNLKTGVDAFTHSKKRLKDAAKAGGIKLEIEKRICRTSCICLDEYSDYLPSKLKLYFG